MPENDIDVLVARARALAAELNGILDTLADSNVICASVVGSCGPADRGMFHPVDRVSLCLDFKPAKRAE